MFCIKCSNEGKPGVEAVGVSMGYSLCDEDLGSAGELWMSALTMLIAPAMDAYVGHMTRNIVQLANKGINVGDKRTPDDQGSTDVPDAFKDEFPPEDPDAEGPK